MSKTAFTPAPWSIGYNDKRAVLGPKDADGDDLVIATVCSSGRGLNWHTNCQHSVPTKAQGEANARLISAAPELYEALRDFFENPDFVCTVGGNPIRVEAMMARARAALAKARGEP